MKKKQKKQKKQKNKKTNKQKKTIKGDNMGKTSTESSSFGLVLQKLVIAAGLTLLFGAYIYLMQLEYEKLGSSDRELKAIIWILVVLLGSFTYDIFKTIAFLNMNTFAIFKQHLFKILLYIIGIGLSTYFATLLFDGDQLSLGGSIISFFLIFFFMYKAIYHFDKALDAIAKQ